MISLVYGTKNGTAIAVDTVGKGGMIGVPLCSASAYRPTGLSSKPLPKH